MSGYFLFALCVKLLRTGSNCDYGNISTMDQSHLKYNFNRTPMYYRWYPIYLQANELIELMLYYCI